MRMIDNLVVLELTKKIIILEDEIDKLRNGNCTMRKEFKINHIINKTRELLLMEETLKRINQLSNQDLMNNIENTSNNE